MAAEICYVESSVHDHTVYAPGGGRLRTRAERYVRRVESIFYDHTSPKNLVCPSAFRDAKDNLQNHAKQIKKALKHNRQEQDTVIVCAIFQARRARRCSAAGCPEEPSKHFWRYVFSNIEHGMPRKAKEHALELNYHVVYAQQSHSEMEMLQFHHFHGRLFGPTITAAAASDDACEDCRVQDRKNAFIQKWLLL